MTSKPTILIISGGGHTPAHFRPLQILFEHRRYAVHSPRLPSNCLLLANDSSAEDVTLARKIATRLSNEGKEIIVLMHSYGGFVGTEAMCGLGLIQRARAGLTGGVKWLAYMTAVTPMKGESTIEAGMVGGGTSWTSPDTRSAFIE
ncbi:hypothetical protein MW887_003098 [Aspergillus wentii]|nr:hypothetical protein MW887_003098 [Aspergillus wentii]